MWSRLAFTVVFPRSGPISGDVDRADWLGVLAVCLVFVVEVSGEGAMIRRIGGQSLMMGRRRSRYVVPGPRAGSVLLGGGRSGARRRRGGARRPVGRGRGPDRGVWVLGLLVVGTAVVGGLFVWRSVASGDRGRRAAAE